MHKGTFEKVSKISATLQRLVQQDPAGAPRRLACLMTALAPMVSGRLSFRSPILVIRPSFSLPPLELCLGASPSQAEKSRPHRKVSGAGAKATIAAAATGPMPGDRHQPARDPVFLRPPSNLTVEHHDLIG